MINSIKKTAHHSFSPKRGAIFSHLFSKELKQKRTAIFLPLKNSGQFFPALSGEFHSRRRLRKDVEEYLIEEAKDIPQKEKITILIKLRSNEKPIPNDFKLSIHKHFNYRRLRSEKELNRVLRYGYRSLILAIIVLFVVITIAHVFRFLLSQNELAVLIKESLVIIGWVAFWRPAELLLYDWFPIKQEIDLYKRLENCNVEFTHMPVN